MDYNALANALIDALKQSTSAGLAQLDMARRNTFEDMNNRSSKRGTLYSTGGGAQQSRYDGTTYLPNQAKLRSQEQTGILGIKSNLISTQQKIDAMNKAASQLNSIDDNYFNSLLV